MTCPAEEAEAWVNISLTTFSTALRRLLWPACSVVRSGLRLVRLRGESYENAQGRTSLAMSSLAKVGSQQKRTLLGEGSSENVCRLGNGSEQCRNADKCVNMGKETRKVLCWWESGWLKALRVVDGWVLGQVLRDTLMQGPLRHKKA